MINGTCHKETEALVLRRLLIYIPCASSVDIHLYFELPEVCTQFLLGFLCGIRCSSAELHIVSSIHFSQMTSCYYYHHQHLSGCFCSLAKLNCFAAMTDHTHKNLCKKTTIICIIMSEVTTSDGTDSHKTDPHFPQSMPIVTYRSLRSILFPSQHAQQQKLRSTNKKTHLKRERYYTTNRGAIHGRAILTAKAVRAYHKTPQAGQTRRPSTTTQARPVQSHSHILELTLSYDCNMYKNWRRSLINTDVMSRMSPR